MASSFMSKNSGFSSKSFVSTNTPYSVEKGRLEDENSSSSSKFSLPTNAAMNLSTIPMSSPKTVRLSSLSFTLDRAPEEPARESTSHHISRPQVPLLDPLDPDTIECFIEKYDSLGKESNYFDLSKTSK